MRGLRDDQAALDWIRTPAAIRERCNALYAEAVAGRLAHFTIDEAELDVAAAYVIETTRAAFPNGAIPFHSRWRHFAAGGRDRWAAFRATRPGDGPTETARLAIDLAVVAVLLDAGAGEDWRYVEPGTGAEYARSEGLGVASFHWFASGKLGSGGVGVDATALERVSENDLAQAFHVTPANPLVGVAERAALLRRLGASLRARPEVFGATGRPGTLYDYFRSAYGDRLPAAQLLSTLLDTLEGVWPAHLRISNHPLGDVWRHSRIAGDDATRGLVPFHKLAQWLAYSLIEPLAEGGVAVDDLDQLTGLAEYRNGGLFIDLGVIIPHSPAALAELHTVASEFVVEWRALTIVCLDRVARRIRERLAATPESWPLARILEGGTWRAGRRIARERRPDGAPPIRVARDGTVF